jgi:predicted PhzF superfamily epimerase YddE/YHI9
VVVLEQAASAQWMQRLAGRLQQSETASLLPLDGERWGLRWFAPTPEVKLCGHATLPAVVALGSWGAVTWQEHDLCHTKWTAAGELADHSWGLPERPAPKAWIELPKLPLIPFQVALDLIHLLTERLNEPP